MIEISKDIIINENEFKFNFIKASGPGGQNVNKVSTAVQLKFDVLNNTSLTNSQKELLLKSAGKRATNNGIIIIEAKSYRTQEKNKQDSIERLANLIRKSIKKKKPRKKTKPTKASSENRIENKKKRAKAKSLRKRVDNNLE